MPRFVRKQKGLKTLDLSRNNISTPKNRLKRLSSLKINTANLLEIDERISNLNQLKHISITSKCKVRIHESINKLPKIKIVYGSSGVEYYK